METAQQRRGNDPIIGPREHLDRAETSVPAEKQRQRGEHRRERTRDPSQPSSTWPSGVPTRFVIAGLEALVRGLVCVPGAVLQTRSTSLLMA